MSRRTCPHCHKLVRGPVKFCPHCGMHLPTGGPAPWPVWPFVAGTLLVAALIGGVLLLRLGNRPGGQPPSGQPSALAGAGSTAAATIPPTAAEPTPLVEPTAAPALPTSTQAPPTSEPAPTEAPTQVVEASPVPPTTDQTNAASLSAEQTNGVETSVAEQANTAFSLTTTAEAAAPPSATPTRVPPPPPQPRATPVPPPPPLFMSVQKTGEGTDPRCINVRIFLPQGYPVTTSGWRLVADGLASAPFNRGGYAGVCVPNERQEFTFTIQSAGGVRIVSGNRAVPAKGGEIFEAYTQQ